MVNRFDVTPNSNCKLKVQGKLIFITQIDSK